jgi:hypothetical protein
VPLVDFVAGNYRFLPPLPPPPGAPPPPPAWHLPPGLREGMAAAPFSGGVVAMPGYEIVRVTLDVAPPYREGFARIERLLVAHGRPRTALCAVELRSPTPYTLERFGAFNAEYGALLAEWGLRQGNGPTARTNVAPVVRPPGEPVLHAFAYTAPSSDPPDGPPAPDAPPATFVVSGAPEPAWLVEANAPLRERARTVAGLLTARLSALGVGWPDVTATSLYTAEEAPVALVTELLATAGPAARHGVHWQLARPPREALLIEIDVRGVRQELRLRP